MTLKQISLKEQLDLTKRELRELSVCEICGTINVKTWLNQVVIWEYGIRKTKLMYLCVRCKKANDKGIL